MSEKEGGYYYSYELFKSIAVKTNSRAEVFTDAMNIAIENKLGDETVNTCLLAIKLCDYLSKKLKLIEELRSRDSQIREGKIALADSEIQEIKEYGAEIEEIEQQLARQNLSVNFH